MYNNIFDSHAHYCDEAFDSDRESLLASLEEAGICGVMTCAEDIKSSESNIALAQRYDFIWAAAGVHAHEASNAEEDYLSALASLVENPRVRAVGEIGLDYHYDFSPREVQKKIFEQQREFAVERSLPVIVHDREAHEDVLELLRKYRPKGVVHCFSGSAELMRETVKLGMYIGLGGAVTFKNARKPVEVAAQVPSEYLLIETDSPYMTPVPFRGKRCDSRLIPYTAEAIALARGCTAQEVLDITAENARRLFLE